MDLSSSLWANKITRAKVAGACGFMRLVLSRLPSSRSGAYRHFAQFYRSPLPCALTLHIFKKHESDLRLRHFISVGTFARLRRTWSRWQACLPARVETRTESLPHNFTTAQASCPVLTTVTMGLWFWKAQPMPWRTVNCAHFC